MASVLALVSKKIFEADARVGGALVGVGDVWATDRYTSTNKKLGPLNSGGDLYLVTVRPPDEKLLLVAVLKGPRFDETRWLAEPNVETVRDITTLAGSLRFTSGKGLNLTPGKLGMSLQTPRELTDDDVTLLTSHVTTVVSAPKRATRPAPPPTSGSEVSAVEAARALSAEALDEATLKELDAASANADKAAALAGKAFKGAAKKLGQTEAALKVLNWGAEVLREADNAKNGTGLFNAARTLERKLKATLAPTERFAFYERFRAACMLEEPQLRGLIKDIAKAREVDSVDALLDLCVRWAEPPAKRPRSYDARMWTLTDALGKALGKLGKAVKRPDLEAVVVLRALPSLHSADTEVLERNEATLAKALEQDATLRRRLAGRFPKIADDSQGWRRLLLSGGVIDDVAERGPDASVEWLEKLLNWVPPREDIVGWLTRALTDTPLGETIRTSSRPVDLSRLRLAQDVGLVDVLVEHGVPLEASEETTFNMVVWSRTPERRPLKHVVAHPRWSKRLARSYDRWNHQGRDGVLQQAAMASAAADLIFGDKVAQVAQLLEGATVARLDQELEKLQPFMTPETIGALPKLQELVRSLDVADMLARNLRGGLMDEWSWPAQDAANDALGSDARRSCTAGPFPYLTLHHQASRQVVVIGPEGEVYRQALDEDVPDYANRMHYVDGDVLFYTTKGSLKTCRWLSDPADTFKAELVGTFTWSVTTPKGASWDGFQTLRPGARTWTRHTCRQRFTDGVRFWCGGMRIDPDTGKKRGEGLPEWFEAQTDDGELVLSASMYWPVPPQAANSPLGVRDGQAGIRVRKLPDESHVLETIDGRRWQGRIPRAVPLALFSFPERGEACVLVQRGPVPSDRAIYLGDGSHPVLPDRFDSFAIYWNGAPQWLPLMWWHYLEPRDIEGSRALAACTTAQARALLDAAAEEKREADATEVLTTEGAVTATLRRAEKRERWTLTRLPRLAATIDQVFPTMTAERLKGGIARIVERAAMLEGQVRQWQASAKKPVAMATGGLEDVDVQALGSILGGGWHHAPRHFEAAIRSAEAFLLDGDATPVPAALQTWPVAASRIPWQGLLLNLGAVVRQMLSPATSEETRQQLIAALQVWADSDFAAHAEAYRVMGVRMSAAPPDMTHQSGDMGVIAAGRHVLRTRRFNPGDFSFEVIERGCADGTFTDPDWGEVTWRSNVGDGCWHGVEGLERALSLAKDGKVIAWNAEIGRRISEATGLLPASAARLWLGAVGGLYEVSAGLRKMLGMKKADLDMGALELPRDWQEVYEQSMPADPTALLEPLADDGSGLSPVDRLIDVWLKRYGKRTPLDVDVVRRLHADFGTKKESFHLDVRVFEEPDKHAFLTKDARFVVHPWKGFMSNVSYMRGFVPPGWPKYTTQAPGDGTTPDVNKAFTGWVLRYFLRFVCWAHQELPFGHPHRAGLSRLCALVGERLANPDLLLLAGAVDLSEETEPRALQESFEALVARFEGAPYEAPVGKVSADGIDRGDVVVTWPHDVKNSVFIAFRPSRVADSERFAAMAQDLGFYDVFKRTGGGCSCGLNFGRHRVVDITDLPAWLVWQSEGFQRVVASLAEEGGPGSFQSDPRVSAPAVVAEAAAQLGVTEDAATLFLQLLTLAEPTDARVMRYSGWTKKRLAGLQKELTERGLVEEAKYTRTKRKLFLPGELAFLTSPARTMEASKLPLYGLEPDEKGRYKPPFGVVLPLRPLAELFEEAWRRFADR